MIHDQPSRDRVGLGWRPELAAGILANLDRVDIVEVIADDWFNAPERKLRELRMLGAQLPLMLHGVGLGMASASPVDRRKVDAMAHLCGAIHPECWSEHLAFVRAGGTELGHLAAPPRNEATIEGACRNLEYAARIVGSRPAVENIATILNPPGSTMGEAEWIGRILDESGCDLLLDLHNVYANVHNFGTALLRRDGDALLGSGDGDAMHLLDQVDGGRVRAIHIAGGHETASGRIIDDHLHDVPDAVYRLLADAAARARGPLTVILEQDGAYPPMEAMLRQLDAARHAVAEGRARRAAA